MTQIQLILFWRLKSCSAATLHTEMTTATFVSALKSGNISPCEVMSSLHGSLKDKFPDPARTHFTFIENNVEIWDNALVLRRKFLSRDLINPTMYSECKMGKVCTPACVSMMPSDATELTVLQGFVEFPLNMTTVYVINYARSPPTGHGAGYRCFM